MRELRQEKVARAAKLWRELPSQVFWNVRIDEGISVQEALAGRTLALADQEREAMASFRMDMAPGDLV
jgi:hypothetical protein